jgi:long-chain fatty acid transport protein
VLYKQWETADLFGELYKNQWVLQLGTQYCVSPRVKLRLGYAYAENPINTNLGQGAGGVLPPGPADRVTAGLQYVQATVAAVSRHRIAGGVQFCDIMPGVNLDLFAGGMFRETQNLGEFTTASIQGYWAGGGLTWRFGSCGTRK